MTAFLREIQAFNASDWIWSVLLLTEFFTGVAAVVFVIFKSLKRLKLYVGKDGIKINDAANSKLDHIIERLKKLERDVVALQIMNEHITPCERLRLYDYYKGELNPEPPAGGVPSVTGARNRPVMRSASRTPFILFSLFLYFIKIMIRHNIITILPLLYLIFFHVH